MSLNDPRWGRAGGNENEKPDSSEQAGENPRNEAPKEDAGREDASRNAPRDEEKRQGSDLDELWNDFNKALNGFLGGQGNAGGGDDDKYRNTHRVERPFSRDEDGADNPPPPPEEPTFRRMPSGRRPSINMGVGGFATLVAACVLGWAATGFYIVPEGQVGVVTTFGRYTKDAAPGFNWRMPWPVQDSELVDVSSVRKTEIGIRGTTSRLKEALMLTDDENIVDLQFNVQYRIKPAEAKSYLFRVRDPDQSVHQAAESAMREVVGRKTMDSVLFESKQEIAEGVKKSMQEMLSRYETGIEVMSVAIQNAQPPEQVQAAFNDAVKAGQDRERQINEGEAYANAVIPKARGTASRLTQEAEGYRARVVETATGEAERFTKILAQYQKAPQVTRDRLYVDIMKDLYANNAKILVDTQKGSNLLYLPLDKLVEKGNEAAKAATSAAPTTSSQPAPATQSATAVQSADTTGDIDARTMMRLRGR